MSQAALRVLLFGGSGQVGSELRRRPWPLPVTIVAPGRAEADLLDPATLAGIVRREAPDVVVNAAAYTAVDKAESEPGAARAVNAISPAAIAEAAAAIGAPLIHYSTDYVFDGSKDGLYQEGDAINPLSVYGATKAEGEAAIRSAHPRHVILRTSWVYGAVGANFVKTMLRLAAERPELRIVDDQVGAPTAAADIADATMIVVQRLLAGAEESGTFHFTGGGETTWRGFAETIFDLAAASGQRTPKVTPITTADYPTPARRPLNSRLDCRRIEQAYGIRRRPWAEALEEVMGELSGRKAQRSVSAQ